MNLLDQEVIIELFRSYYVLFIFWLFFGTFILTYYIVPKVLWVSKEKNLMAPVIERSSHATAVPSFGGVAFYITLILVLSLIQSMRLAHVGNHLIAAITILFMVGLKDDLIVSTARVKLFGQIAASCFIVFSPELQLDNLYGFWGLYEIPVLLGYILMTILCIAIINAYNLIDGIDGLAASIGIVISGMFAIVFYTTGHPFFVLVSVSLAGTLSAFLRYNFSRGERKIFMGDSGSLIVGLILAFLAIKLLTREPYEPLVEQGVDPGNRPLFLACLFIIPFLDTIRVMLIRMLNKRSPFSADRNHVHHVLLDLGFSHKRTCLILASVNVSIIVIYIYALNELTNLWLSCFVCALYAGLFLIIHQLKIRADRTAKLTHSIVQI
jgi:UDP-GlcNAc:undecaprenyl-phosphate/decaprenyl-phosphate GlcNAc-1-phosphate transferase